MISRIAATLVLLMGFAPLLAWGVRIPDPIPTPISKGDVSIGLKTVAKGLLNPVTATFAPNDKNHLFIAEQNGKIWSLTLNNSKNSKDKGGARKLFVNFSSLGMNLGCFSVNYDERGLLGLAFHPKFRKNGLFYTYQSQPHKGAQKLPANQCDSTSPDHDNVVTEWKVRNPGKGNAKVDLKSGREVLRIDHPQFNHNGGELRFGPDNMLYISIGDGGNADDQGPGHTTLGGNAQDLSNLLGKILRIDPNTGSRTPGYNIPTDNPFVGRVNARGEIWAYGFRNPYKMSFDKETGLLYVADVGQNDVEEVDIVFKGKNYGWPIKEGSFAFDQNGTADGFVTDVPVSGDFVDPIAQFDHCIPPINLTGPCTLKEGLAIVGGFVYRGNEIKALRGRYVFGSYSSVFIASAGRLFYLDGQNQVKEFNLPQNAALGLGVLGIGQDARGELYVLGKSGASASNTGITDPANTSGVVRKLVAAKVARGGSGKPGKPKPTPVGPGY